MRVQRVLQKWAEIYCLNEAIAECDCDTIGFYESRRSYINDRVISQNYRIRREMR